MKLNYELGEDDFLAFNMSHMQHSETVKKAINLQRYLTPILFMMIAFLFAKLSDSSLIFALIVFGSLGVLWVAFYPKYFYRYTRRQTMKMLQEGKNDGLLGHQQMLLSEEGFIYLTSNGENHIKWTGIKKIIEDDLYFYLYNSAVSAVILPKRAVENVDVLKKYFKSNLVIII